MNDPALADIIADMNRNAGSNGFIPLTAFTLQTLPRSMPAKLLY